MPARAARGGSLAIGFVSTRFSGLDGVSLEAAKWAAVLEELGHRCFWFAGELDRDPRASLLVPEAFFGRPEALELDKALFSAQRRTRETTNALHRQKELLKDALYTFLDRFGIDLVIVENALSIPMHVPLGMALTELIAETGIPAIAHHHDFFWERPRFLSNACGDILGMAFPPDLPSVQHVVINSLARVDLAARRGIAARLIPNVMDFDAEPLARGEAARRVREEMGFGRDDVLVLQPTRVVQRKGIEQAIHLVKRLGIPNARLIVSHAAGDEGAAYAEWIAALARELNVPLHLIHDRTRKTADPLPDLYAAADFVTFPSVYEGFGNAFLEAVFYSKPLLVNRYPVYAADIEPKGFDVVLIDGYVTDEAVRSVRRFLSDPERRAAAIQRNRDIARVHFSFQVLRRELESLISALPQGSPAEPVGKHCASQGLAC